MASCPCSCGEHESHVIVTRQTFDGVTVQLWSDGAIATRLGGYVKYPKRAALARARAVEFGRRFMAEVELYEWAEALVLWDRLSKRTPAPHMAPAYVPTIHRVLDSTGRPVWVRS